MAEPDLEEMFGAEAPVDDMASEEGDEENDVALDAAIDELLTADDPATRREAFKRAISLCKDGGY